jgi:hypothetical protein
MEETIRKLEQERDELIFKTQQTLKQKEKELEEHQKDFVLRVFLFIKSVGKG